jgi:hypothetical protein
VRKKKKVSPAKAKELPSKTKKIALHVGVNPFMTTLLWLPMSAWLYFLPSLPAHNVTTDPVWLPYALTLQIILFATKAAVLLGCCGYVNMAEVLCAADISCPVIGCC